jgi:hypothetical protein
MFMKVGDTYYWYLNDHLCTPLKMVDSNGENIWSHGTGDKHLPGHGHTPSIGLCQFQQEDGYLPPEPLSLIDEIHLSYYFV